MFKGASSLSSCYRHFRAVAAAAAILASIGLAQPARAMHPKVEFDEIVHSSDAIVLGEVVGQSARLNEQGAILTDVTLRVDAANPCRL